MRLHKRLRKISLRDLLLVAAPSLLLLLLGFWAAAQFIRPAPPKQLVFSSGGEGGAYQSFAARYSDVLARYDVTLVEKPSAGAVENLQRLRDENSGVDAAFVQGGIATAGSDDNLLSLGSLYYEPLWIFYRAALAPLDRISQLKGRRIAVGAMASGTYKLALELLEANGISGQPTQLVTKSGMAAVLKFVEYIRLMLSG